MDLIMGVLNSMVVNIQGAPENGFHPGGYASRGRAERISLRMIPRAHDLARGAAARPGW